MMMSLENQIEGAGLAALVFNQIGKCTLINEDCVTAMDKLIDEGIKVDCVLTDPPYEYGNGMGGGNTELSQKAKKVRQNIAFISKGFEYDAVFERMLKICKVPNLLIFCSNKQITKIMSYFENKKLSVTLLTWDKTNPIPCCNKSHVSNLEFVVYVRGKGATWNDEAPFNIKSKTKKYPTVCGKGRLHPTEKPLKLIEEYLELHTKENQLVLDCFGGSFTTGVACQNLNRQFIGIEYNPTEGEHDKFYNIGLERIKKNYERILQITNKI